MARLPFPSVLALSLPLIAACTPPEPPRCPQASPAATTSARPSVPTPAADEEADPEGNATFRLALTMKPIAESATVEVDITARGPASDLDEWTITAPSKDALRSIEARDIDGAIPVTTTLAPAEEKPGVAAPSSAPAALRIRLARPPLGPLRLAYTLAAKPTSLSTTPVVEVDADFFRALGRSLLALPDAANDDVIAASLTIDISDYSSASTSGPSYGAASSFGIGGSREVKARASDLREAAYFMGRIGTAVFDTVEGHDEAAWFGFTAFDPRPIAADVASFRTAVRQLFRDAESPPSTLFIIPDARPSGSFIAARRAGGVIVHLNLGEPWTGAVRIAVAAEVLKAWIGERVWVGPAAAGQEAQAYWFTEGVTRHLARDLLFRFGLITPSELLDEVHGLVGTLATSPRKAESNVALAARAADPGVLPLLVARGALYATRVDAALRAKTGSKTSLDDILRALYAKAREQRGPLPTSAWTDAIAKDLGPLEADAFATMIEKGGEIRVPDAAFGPCFRAAPRRYEPFDLGFEEATVAPGEPRKVASVRAGGPADKAGLRAGDVLAEAKITRGRSDIPVTLSIERGAEKKTLTYRPAGPAATGQGWVRKKDVPDEACAR
jgi:hypothetical protein